MKYLSYIITLAVGIFIGWIAYKALTPEPDYTPVIIHTDTYKSKYEVAFDLIKKQHIKIDSLKKLQKQKYIIVYETTNDSIPSDNIPRSFRELANYLNQ